MKKDAFDVPPSNYEYIKTKTNPNSAYWVCTMFGTAVGAGILYLPVQAGICSIWSLIIASIFMFPTIYFSHKAIVTLLTKSRLLRDYSGTINRYLGVTFGFFINIVFFLTWFTVLLMYSIGLNENGGVFLKFIGLTKINLANTLYFSLIILIVLLGTVKFFRKALLKIMSVLSIMLIIFLLGISIFLIPHWNYQDFLHFPGISTIIIQLLLIIPILTMSFVFFPAMSTMVIAYRQAYDTEKTSPQQLNKVVLYSTWILLFFVLFFVFSCVLSFSPSSFQLALQKNINCLTLFSIESKGSGYYDQIGTIIGLLALITSFIGIFFAVEESARHIILTIFRIWFKKDIDKDKIDNILLISLLILLWWITIARFSVVAVLGALIAPLVSFFLFLLPVFIFYIRPSFKKNRTFINILVFSIGVLLLFSFKLGLFLQQL